MGAQVAVMGETAIGAKVLVWWPLDEQWYPGMVSWSVTPQGGRHLTRGHAWPHTRVRLLLPTRMTSKYAVFPWVFLGLTTILRPHHYP